MIEVSEELHLTQCSQAEHGVIEGGDLLNGDLLPGGLVECGALEN